MTHEEYEWYKSRHICVNCKAADAVRGQTRCPDCQELQKLQSKVYYDTHKEKMNQYSHEYYKRTYQERLDAGLCTCCGKRPPKTGCKRCETCLARKRRTRRQRIIRQGAVPRDLAADLKICYLCCKNPVIKGFKICKSCYNSVTGRDTT